MRFWTLKQASGVVIEGVHRDVTLAKIWVFLKWAYLGWPRRGGRDVWAELFPLTMFQKFLIEAIKAIYGAVQSVSLPRATSAEAQA